MAAYDRLRVIRRIASALFRVWREAARRVAYGALQVLVARVRVVLRERLRELLGALDAELLLVLRNQFLHSAHAHDNTRLHNITLPYMSTPENGAAEK